MRISERRIKQIINEETRQALREADIKGGSFAVKSGYKLPADLKPGDRMPADMFDEPSMSPEEGPGARAAMRLREPGMKSVGDPDYLASLDFGSDEDDENKMLDYAHASGGRAPVGLEDRFDDSYNQDEDEESMLDYAHASGGRAPVGLEDRFDDSYDEEEEEEDEEEDEDEDEDEEDLDESRVRKQRNLNFRSIVKEETLKFLRNRR